MRIRSLRLIAGGPSGGNGGRGGHIWAVVDEGLNSLTTFRRQLHFRAKPGLSGAGSSRHGAHGEDMEIPVPRGTVIRQKDAQSGDPPIAELLTPGNHTILPLYYHQPLTSQQRSTCFDRGAPQVGSL